MPLDNKAGLFMLLSQLTFCLVYQWHSYLISFITEGGICLTSLSLVSYTIPNNCQGRQRENPFS